VNNIEYETWLIESKIKTITDTEKEEKTENEKLVILLHALSYVLLDVNLCTNVFIPLVAAELRLWYRVKVLKVKFSSSRSIGIIYWLNRS